MKWVVGLCVILLALSMAAAAPNCNLGMTDGEYYCFHNSIPFRLFVDGFRFQVVAQAWGCDKQLEGDLHIRGSTIRLDYDNVDHCPRFAEYQASTHYDVVFEEGCGGFRGTEGEDGHDVRCELREVYQEPYIYQPVVVEDADSASVVVLSTTVFLALVVLMF